MGSGLMASLAREFRCSFCAMTDGPLLDLSGEGLRHIAMMISNYTGPCYPDLVSMRSFVTTRKLAHRWYYCDYDPDGPYATAAAAAGPHAAPAPPADFRAMRLALYTGHGMRAGLPDEPRGAARVDGRVAGAVVFGF